MPDDAWGTLEPPGVTAPLGEPDSAGSGEMAPPRGGVPATRGTRDYADLPHVCRCGRRWSGTGTAHCRACDETFSGVAAFDLHRRGRPGDHRFPPGHCYYPGDLGLTLLPDRAYRCWGTVASDESGASA